MNTIEEVKNLKDRLKNAKNLCRVPVTNNTTKKEMNYDNDFTDDECLDPALLNLSDNEETWLCAVKSNPDSSQQDFPDVISWLRFATKPQGFADNLNDSVALQQSEMRFDSRTYTRPKRRLPQPSLSPECWGLAVGGGKGRWSGVTNASSNTTLSPLIDLDTMSQLDSPVSSEALQEYLRVSPQRRIAERQSSCAHIASDSSSILLQTPTSAIPMSRLQEFISPQLAEETMGVANVTLGLQTAHLSADASLSDTFDKRGLDESRTCASVLEVAQNASQVVLSKTDVRDSPNKSGGNNNVSTEESNSKQKDAEESLQLNHNSKPPVIEAVNPHCPSNKTPPLKDVFQPVFNSTPSRGDFIPLVNGLLSDSPIKQAANSYVSNSHLRIEEGNPSPILSEALPLCSGQLAGAENVMNNDAVGNLTVTNISRDLNTTFDTVPTSALVNKSLLHHVSSSVLNTTFSKTEVPSLNTTFCRSADGLNGTFSLRNPPEDDQTSSASDSSFSSASNPIRSLGDVQNMARQQEQSLQPQNVRDPRLPVRTLRRQGFRSEEILAPIPQGSDDGNQSDQSDISSLTRSSAHSSPCRSTNNLLRNNNNNINRPSFVPAPKQIVNRLTQEIRANDVRRIVPPRQSLLRAPSARAPATALRASGIRPPSVNITTGIPRPAVSRIPGSRMPRFRGRGRTSTSGNWTDGCY